MRASLSLRRLAAGPSPDLLICLAACANGLAARVVEDVRAPAPSLLLGLSPFELLAAALAARLLTQGQGAEAPRVGLAHGLAALAMLAPSASGAWAVLFAFAGWRALRTRGPARAGFLIFAAFALAQAWGAIGFKMVSGPLLALDAALAAQALALLGMAPRVLGNVVEVAGGHSIVVLVTCATLHRLPLALVAALALAAPASLRDCVRICALAAVGYCALNLARLVLMGLSPQHYAFMHEGAGAGLYDAAQTILVFLVAGRRPGPERAP
jgi:hypothetical protein